MLVKRGRYKRAGALWEEEPFCVTGRRSIDELRRDGIVAESQHIKGDTTSYLHDSGSMDITGGYMQCALIYSTLDMLLELVGSSVPLRDDYRTVGVIRLHDIFCRRSE